MWCDRSWARAARVGRAQGRAPMNNWSPLAVTRTSPRRPARLEELLRDVQRASKDLSATPRAPELDDPLRAAPRASKDFPATPRTPQRSPPQRPGPAPAQGRTTRIGIRTTEVRNARPQAGTMLRGRSAHRATRRPSRRRALMRTPPRLRDLKSPMLETDNRLEPPHYEGAAHGQAAACRRPSRTPQRRAAVQEKNKRKHG